MNTLLPVLLCLLMGLSATASFADGGAGGCPYALPLDTKPAAAAYSFRALASKQIDKNIVKLRRSSDSATKIFTASLPTCAIDTHDRFFDGSTYTLLTWYDQSGHHADITAPSESAAPIVHLQCLNGYPCGVYNGQGRYLTGTLSSPVGADTFAAVANMADASGGKYIVQIGAIYANATSMNYSHSSGACVSLRWADHTPSKAAISCKTNAWYSWIASQSLDSSRIYLNGIAGGEDIKGNTDSHLHLTLHPSNALYIGESSDSANRWQGELNELIVFSPDLPQKDSDEVSANQKAYWGIH